jgi:hypothetical protein
MNFPFVTRKKYERVVACAQKLCADVIRLQDERDAILGNACQLAEVERADREQERGHFEAILTNLRGAQ